MGYDSVDPLVEFMAIQIEQSYDEYAQQIHPHQFYMYVILSQIPRYQPCYWLSSRKYVRLNY